MAPTKIQRLVEAGRVTITTSGPMEEIMLLASSARKQETFAIKITGKTRHSFGTIARE